MTTTHTITVHITESAQRAAALAGEPAQAVQTYPVPRELLAELSALPWTKIDDQGTMSCVVPTRIPYWRDTVEGDRPVDLTRSGPSYGAWDGGATGVRPSDAAAAIAHGRKVVADATDYLLAERAKYKAEQAESRSRHEAKIAAWLALPREQQVRRYYETSRTDYRYVVAADSDLLKEPAIAARAAELAPYLKECEEKASAPYRRWLAACRDYVIAHVPEYARAARAGADVSNVAGDAALDQIEQWLADAGLDVLETANNQRDQDLPRSLAYERLDAVRAALSDRVRDIPIVTGIETSIVRVDVDPRRGRTAWRTAVRIEIAFADGETAARYVCAEEECSAPAGDEDSA